MAIIVNKEEKRRNIALSCRELLLEKGINALTISEIAKTAGIGKGTVYEYFKNKEDIVFEIITTFIEEHQKKLLALQKQSIPLRDKLYAFIFLLFEDTEQLKIFKEFLGISLTTAPPSMLTFSENCKSTFIIILNEILKEHTTPTITPNSILIFIIGLVVESRLESLEIEKEINLFLDILLKEKE